LKLKYIYGFRILNSVKPVIIILTVLALMAGLPFASAQGKLCAVYVTGIGCPNCAITDPAVTSGFAADNPDYVVIEYEIYQKNADNYPVADGYFSSYIPQGVRQGVPFLILGTENTYIGRYEVLEAESAIAGMSSNDCPMPDGSSVNFGNLDISSLEGKPNIWTSDRVLVSEGGGAESGLLRDLLFGEDIEAALEGSDYEETEPVPVKLSGSEVNFEHAVQLDGWLFQWNDGNNGSVPVNGGGNGETDASSLYLIAAVIIILIGLVVYLALFR
jgi:hypothetical protein